MDEKCIIMYFIFTTLVKCIDWKKNAFVKREAWKVLIDLHTAEQLRMYFMLSLGKRQTNIELYNICRPVKDISIWFLNRKNK